MNHLTSLIIFLEIAALVYVSITDIAARIIPNTVCLMIAVLAISNQMLVSSPLQFLASLLISLGMFLALLLVHSRGWMGGGDVKLLTVVSMGLPAMAVIGFLTSTVMAGGVLAIFHLILRYLPYPARPPAGSSIARRIYAIERWRNLRRAPLPYGVAIACGGIFTLISHGV